MIALVAGLTGGHVANADPAAVQLDSPVDAALLIPGTDRAGSAEYLFFTNHQGQRPPEFLRVRRTPSGDNAVGDVTAVSRMRSPAGIDFQVDAALAVPATASDSGGDVWFFGGDDRRKVVRVALTRTPSGDYTDTVVEPAASIPDTWPALSGIGGCVDSVVAWPHKTDTFWMICGYRYVTMRFVARAGSLVSEALADAKLVAPDWRPLQELGRATEFVPFPSEPVTFRRYTVFAGNKVRQVVVRLAVDPVVSLSGVDPVSRSGWNSIRDSGGETGRAGGHRRQLHLG